MGKIKKLLEVDLVGGTQETDLYPVTSTKAVYSPSNKSLDDIIQDYNTRIHMMDLIKISAKSVNLVNPQAVLEGLSIRQDGTASSSIKGYGIIYVPIDDDGIYVTKNISGTRYHALYDENLKYIEGTSTQSNYIAYVPEAKYAGCSIFSNIGFTDVMINKGNSALPLEPYNPLKGYDVLSGDIILSTDNYQDKSVTIGKMDLNTEYFLDSWTQADYRGSIAELYLRPEIVPKGVKMYCKNYNGLLYVRPENFAWNSKMVPSLSQAKEGEVIEIRCTTAGNGVSYNDIVGYVILRNKQIIIEHVNAGTSAGEPLNTALSTTLLPWGEIEKFLFGGINGESIKDGTITQEKLDPSLTIASGLESGVDIELPDEIIAVEGDTLQIFWRSIIHAYNPYIFDIISICSVGKHYPRYYTFTPTSSNVGKTYNLQVLVRKNNLTTLVAKTTTIKVVAKPTSPASLTKVLCIGASATAGGTWPYELMRRLTLSSGDNTPANPTGLSLSNIEFVGRKTGTVKDIKLEATGGWKVQTYASAGEKACRFYVTGVTQLNIGDTYTDGVHKFSIAEINVTNGEGNIRCIDGGDTAASPNGTLNRVTGSGDSTITYTSFESESYNPFWNESTESLDFRSYARTYCGGSIDLQIWHCGVNDIFGGNESIIPTVIESFRSILRAYHTQFPNGKVIISSVPVGSPTGGFGANYGAAATGNYFTFLNMAQKYATALIALCKESEFSSFTKYASVLEEFDCENAYPATLTNVNNRQDIKESLGTNGVHPVTAGSYMVSDGVYRAFADLY